MKRLVVVGLVLGLALVAACGDGKSGTPDAPALAPADNPAREVTATALAFDLGAKTATATLTLAPSEQPGATLESGDLVIQSVTDATGGAVAFADAVTDPGAGSGGGDVKSALTLGLPASSDPSTVTVAYTWAFHEGFTGISQKGFTLNWPYFCGNMFPCHSDPTDGTTFTLALAGVPGGKLAVFPATIPTAAPAYQLAWSIDAYTELPLGTTTAGTAVSIWYRPNELARAQTGGTDLVAAFDWLEKTLGPYRFGSHVGSVSVAWPAGAYGGMEHHPFWHVAAAALNDENTHVHEASHGWYGDGIRLACWEDFVLSEGTVSYLAARALDVVAPAQGQKSWDDYAGQLGSVAATDPVWPDSCGAVDVIKDNLFTNAPYMRGAFFYRAVALKVGADQLDAALHTFYMAHQGQPAKMADMLTTIHDVTGFDPTACATAWLRATTIPTPNVACD